MEFNYDLIEQKLLKCWSLKTSSKYSKQNPYKGQCGVTALIINDWFGGKILKTKADDQWHFYNLVNGKRIDFTKNQFDFQLDYKDIETTREDALKDTDEFQYQELKCRFKSLE